jgi:hypothetical protein
MRCTMRFHDSDRMKAHIAGANKSKQTKGERMAMARVQPELLRTH